MKAHIETIADGKVGIVCLEGEIDFSVLSEVRSAIEEGFATNPACLLVDLSDVPFIASDGLGVLIEARRRADDEGRKLELIHPQPHVAGLLRKTQLTRLFQIFQSVEDALRSLGS